MISFLLLSLLIVCSITLYVSVKKNLELLDKLQQLDDELQICLKVLEQQIDKIDAKTKIEVFSDEPIIRELILDMSIAKDAVIAVSNTIDSLIEEQDDEQA